MSILLKTKENFSNTEKYLKNLKDLKFLKILEYYGQLGVNALSANTPIDTGMTAASWSYKVEIGKKKSSIKWTNSNVNNGVPIAIILQYGHVTKNGGWVEGQDYINPALKNIINKISEAIGAEVKKL